MQISKILATAGALSLLATTGAWAQAAGDLSQTASAPGDPRKAAVGGQTWAADQEVVASVRVDAWQAGDYARANNLIHAQHPGGTPMNGEPQAARARTLPPIRLRARLGWIAEAKP